MARSVWLLIFLAACDVLSPPDTKPEAEICDNLADDDGDGFADCTDTDCAAVCGENCGDGIDNDGDGLVDCFDDQCDGMCGEVCDDGRDNDGDGAIDCDDGDCVGSCPEVCGDGLDNDGDGLVDCLDADCVDPACPETCSDGWDNDADGLVDCDDPDCVSPVCPEVCDDGVDNDGDARADCDDPDCDGACPEVCDDARDNDADGLVDCADPECEPLCDVDGDGFYGEDYGGDDCDDTRFEVNPARPEICNDGESLDDDCDGLVDEADPDIDPRSLIGFYPDVDGDGHGANTEVQFACHQPPGWAAGNLDCDDSNPEVNPDMPEICNPDEPLDDDCDGLVDDADPDVDVDSFLEWYADRDDDGWGAAGDFVFACSRPDDGTAANDEDCDDGDPTIGPPSLWYADEDDDGFGAGEALDDEVSCEPPFPGLEPDWIGLDCEDRDPTIYPDAPEVCEDGIDQDCDGDDSRCAALILIYSESNRLAEEAAVLGGHIVTATDDEAAFVRDYDLGGWEIVIMETPTSGMGPDQAAVVVDATSRGIPLIFSWWDLDSDRTVQDALGVSTVEYTDPPTIYADPGAPEALWDGVSTPMVPTSDAWGDNGDYLTLTRGGTVLGRHDSPSGEVVIALTNDDTTIVNGFLPDNFLDLPDMVQLYHNEINLLFDLVLD